MSRIMSRITQSYLSLGIQRIHDDLAVKIVIVEGYVELSSRDILNKSYILSAVLALHGAYRAWRFPENAVLLQVYAPS